LKIASKFFGFTAVAVAVAATTAATTATPATSHTRAEGS